MQPISDHPYITNAIGLLGGYAVYRGLRKQLRLAPVIGGAIPVATLVATVVAMRTGEQPATTCRQLIQDTLIAQLEDSESTLNQRTVVLGSYWIEIKTPNYDLPDCGWTGTWHESPAPHQPIVTLTSSYASDFGPQNYHPITISLSASELAHTDPTALFEQKLQQFLAQQLPILRLRLEHLKAAEVFGDCVESITDVRERVNAGTPISQEGLKLLESLEAWRKDVGGMGNPVKWREIAMSRLVLHKPDALTFDACFEGERAASTVDYLRATAEWTDAAGVKKSLSMGEVLNWKADQLRSFLSEDGLHNT